MRLVALVVDDGLAAPPTVLGRSLAELHVARAREVGARHVVCLVREILPKALSIADRWRAQGLVVDVVRTIADAANAVHPDETVLLVASRAMIGVRALRELLGDGAPAILCVEKTGEFADFEIIDAATRWTGFALLDGIVLRRVAGIVGDWDVASTLLRQLVQQGGRRVVLSAQDAGAEIVPVRDAASAVAAGRKLLQSKLPASRGAGGYWVSAPASRGLARLAGETEVSGSMIAWFGLAFAAAAAVMAFAGWLGASLVLLTVALLGQATTERLAAAGAGVFVVPNYFGPAREGAASLVAIGAGMTLMASTGQWGCLLLAALTVGAQILSLRSIGSSREARWLADPLSLALLGLAGLVARIPVITFFAIAGYALASFLWLDRKARNSAADQA